MDRETEEALCDLQAQVTVLRLALRAFLRTHPNPGVALIAWRTALAEGAETSLVLPEYARHSEYLAERCQAFAEDWTAELVERTVPSPPVLPKDTT